MVTSTLPRQRGVSHPDDLKSKPLPPGYEEPKPFTLMPKDVLDAVRGAAVATPSVPAAAPVTTPAELERSSNELQAKKVKTVKTIKSASDLLQPGTP